MKGEIKCSITTRFLWIFPRLREPLLLQNQYFMQEAELPPFVSLKPPCARSLASLHSL